jgi:hypothetical protein
VQIQHIRRCVQLLHAAQDLTSAPTFSIAIRFQGLLLAGHSAAPASISLLQFVLQIPDEFATLTVAHHSRSSVTQGPDVLKSRTHLEVILHPLSGPSNSGFYISLQDRIFGPSRLADIGQSSPLTVACTVSCGRGDLFDNNFA